MSFFNKKIYIDRLVLRAKIGNKEEFVKLREIYSTLQEQIFKGFCKSYPFLKSRRMDLFREFYFFFWEAIKTYDFESPTSFSYHLKDSLIESAREIMCVYYGYEIDKVTKKKDIKAAIIKKEPSRNRKIAAKAIKQLTPIRKLHIYLHCYRNLTYDKCRNYTKTKRNSIETTVTESYRAIKDSLTVVRMGNKREWYREKVYKIYQEKLETIK